MNISLTKELEEFTRGLVSAGRYNNASEVVRSGLRLLEERESKIRALSDLIHEGIKSGSAGAYDAQDIRGGLRSRAATLQGEVERGERLDPRDNPNCTLGA